MKPPDGPGSRGLTEVSVSPRASRPFKPRGSRTAMLVGPFQGIVIAVPGRGKSTVLIPALLDAGLPAVGVISLDVIRKKLYGRPDILGGSEVEQEARRLEEARMIAGQSVVRDSTGLNKKVRKAQVRRAHRGGIRAVALLSSSLSLTELHRRNRQRSHPVPNEVLEMFYGKHAVVTVEELWSEGFDQVVVWNDHTTFRASSSGECNDGRIVAVLS